MEECDPNNNMLKDAQNESMLYLSSNWSAGGFSNKLSQKKAMNEDLEIDDKSKQIPALKIPKVEIPRIDIQKAIDYPRSDIDSESKALENMKNCLDKKTDRKN